MKLNKLFEYKFLIKILALFCLQGCTQTDNLSQPKNIILMIGDGMGLSQITAAIYSSQKTLSLEEIQHIGLIKTNSASSIITDSAAGATAQSYSKGNQIFNTGTAGSFDFLVPSTLLSDQNSSFTSTADDTTPFIVVCKVQWEAGNPAQKKSLRFVFIIRYQPQ